MDDQLEDKRNASSNPSMERHMIFVCPECGQTLSTQQEWRQHLNTIHDYAKKKAKDFDFKEIDTKYHECQICLKRLAHGHHSPVLLQYHRFSHLNYGGPFRCRYCAGSFAKKRALSVHLFRFHNQKINRLNNEYKLSKMRQAMALRHPRFNKEFFMRFICPQCGKSFQRFREWHEHIDNAHTNTLKNLCMHRIICTRDYYCDQCSDTLKNAPTQDQLRRHHFSHSPHPCYFQCAFCVTQKSFKTDLFLHFIKHHRMDYLKNKKYICCPEEWGGPAKVDTINEIQIYTESDELIVTSIWQHKMGESLPKSIPEREPDNAIRKVYSYRKQEIGSENRPTKISTYSRQETGPTKTSSYHRREAGPPKSKDILQKALRDSCINFEDDFIDDTLAVQANSHRYENMFVVEVKPSNSNELNDHDLELICEEIFEEIKDYSHNEQQISTHSKTKIFKSGKNGVNNDYLKREMQKYINYLCPECLREFDNQPDWRNHVFEQHNLTNAVKSKFRPLNAQKTAYLCLSCLQVQRTSKHVDLQRHYFQHMPHQSYLKCTLCVKTKSSKPKILHHLEHVHGVKIQKPPSKKLQCLECDHSVDDPLQLQNHLRICPGRLEPLSARGQYGNIAKNQKLLKHLQKASLHIDQMLVEDGIDRDAIKI